MDAWAGIAAANKAKAINAESDSSIVSFFIFSTPSIISI
jgi:hypothetical protein